MLDLRHVADVNDDGKLRRKWLNKKRNARQSGHICLLSFEDYAQLLRDATLVSSNVGIGLYHLARYGDTGPYAVGNCRFITCGENNAEKKPPDSEAISRGLLKFYATNPGSFAGRKHRAETKTMIGAANSVSQSGRRNSQFGRKWVNDGREDKKINAQELEFFLAAGWSHGRLSSCSKPKIKIGHVAQLDERHTTNVEDADSTSAVFANYGV